MSCIKHLGRVCLTIGGLGLFTAATLAPRDAHAQSSGAAAQPGACGRGRFDRHARGGRGHGAQAQRAAHRRARRGRGARRRDIDQYQARDLTDIGNLVPGVSFERTGSGNSGAALTIRGVGNLAADYGIEQPVAVNIDGVQITKGHAADMGFFDLDSVQVLKGPQSLFFGKNSPAGVVVLDSVTPGSTLEGYARASYEFSQDMPAFRGGHLDPADDTLSIRIAGRYSDALRGYVANTAEPAPDPFDPGALTLRAPPIARDPRTQRHRPHHGGVASQRRISMRSGRPRGRTIATGATSTKRCSPCGANPHPTTVNLLNPAQRSRIRTEIARRIIAPRTARRLPRSSIISSAGRRTASRSPMPPTS